ncbi:phosphomannomutase/phosphoglucomutase, partial [Candidatus Woesearchaeota archaeon]|nr:phosphomannomutase/phosphoglucomutase [Candidatus Woesearchaeota archaeon]
VSSPKLSRAFMQGAADQGATAIFIGQVCTDAVYFASGFMKKPGVMFTASHNPARYNGMKMCMPGAIPINEDTGLRAIKSIIEKSQYDVKIKKHGRIVKKDILKDYARHVKKFINAKKLRKLKIAVDAGNGMAGKMIPLIYEGIPIKIVPLYFKLDGTFPNHPADPIKRENISDLQEAVREKKCDLGMAFDGDADRIFFVDENGNAVNSSLISALIIKNILGKNKGQKIIHNVVCSRIVPETIRKNGGFPIIERVGHSFIKDTMRRTNAIFACEHSAHYYYRENYRADSGMITIEETSIEVSDKDSKLQEIEAIYKKQRPKKISKIDGITIEFNGWWFNVRPSNTEPLLRLNLEADSEEKERRAAEGYEKSLILLFSDFI